MFLYREHCVNIQMSLMTLWLHKVHVTGKQMQRIAVLNSITPSAAYSISACLPAHLHHEGDESQCCINQLGSAFVPTYY